MIQHARSVGHYGAILHMADRICPHCGKAFKYPRDLRKHMNSRRLCVPLLASSERVKCENSDVCEFWCRFCGRGFTDENNRNRHMRTACKIAPNTKNGDKGMERLYEHIIQKQNAERDAKIAEQGAQITEMKAQNSEILALLRQQQGAPSSSNTLQAGEIALQGDHAQVDNSKRIININVFGQEKLDHVTAERIKAILDECLQRPALPTAVSEAVLKTAMLVYSDPDRPENLTAYLPNKKTKDALVHTKTGWEVQPTQLVLPPMALKSIDTIFGRQPHSDEYAPLLKELQQNEARFAAGEDLQPILVRNKDLLARVLATLPVAGE